MKKRLMASHPNVGADSGSVRVEILEDDLHIAKESEKRMLESLVSQTKQLEQTKISFEEAKLEIASLHEAIRMLRLERKKKANSPEHAPGKGVEVELGKLRNEIMLAWQAEDKNKKAMDALAQALKEVTAESNQARSKLSDALSEMRSTKAEAEHLRSSLSLTEKRLREAKSESQRLKQEAEEVFATWHEKEKGFVSCVKASEDEMKDFREQNKRLMESHRASMEEISKLRDILKQAVNEATVVKEALEIARKENSHLQDLLQEKEHIMNGLKQEHEGLKVSEAAAIHSVKEMKGLIAVTSSSVDSSRGCGYRLTENTPLGLPRVGPAQKTMAKYPSEKWRTVESPLLRNAREFLYWGECVSSPESPRREKAGDASSSPGVKGVNIEVSRRQGEIDGKHDQWSSKAKKRRQILRSFSDILKRKSSIQR